MSTVLPRRCIAAVIGLTIALLLALAPGAARAQSPAAEQASVARATTAKPVARVALGITCAAKSRAAQRRVRRALRSLRRARTRGTRRGARLRLAAARRRAAAQRRRCRVRSTRTSPRPAADPAVRDNGTGTPTWIGDFESGDLKQWDGTDGNEDLLSRYFSLVNPPAGGPAGRHAFAATVDGDAREADEAGQRSLLYQYPNDTPSKNASGSYEGSERWYRTQMYFPQSFRPSPDTTWNWVVEWHNFPNAVCCANLALSVDTNGGGERLALRVMGGGNAQYPVERFGVNEGENPVGHSDWYVGDPQIQRGHWYDMLFHVKWSTDSSQGLVEWWLDGRRIVSQQTSTLFWYADDNENKPGATPGPGQTYFMQGYYRPSTLPDGSTDRSSATVIHDGAKHGPTLASVS